MNKKFDKTDFGILWELYNNSRQPLVKIAHKVKIPKETVKYRMDQLIKNGLLDHFFAIVNNSKFGMTFYEVYLKLQGIPQNVENECLQKLKDHPMVGWLISTNGRFSIAISFINKTHAQFYDCYNFVRKLFGRYIKEIEFCFAVEGHQYDYPFFKEFQKPPIKTKTVLDVHDEKPLDKVDIGILKILTDNARIPLKEISRKIGTTEKTVRSRIKWLEKNKYLLQYTALLHPGHAGYFFYVMLIKLNLPDKDIDNYVKKIPEIFYLVKSAGFYDLKVEFYVTTENRIHQIEEDIYQKFGDKVLHIDTIQVKKEHCVKYFVELQ